MKKIPQTSNSEELPLVGRSGTPEFSGHRIRTSTSSGWWVIRPWRLGAVHELAGTLAVRLNSGSGLEKTARAGPGLLLSGPGLKHNNNNIIPNFPKRKESVHPQPKERLPGRHPTLSQGNFVHGQGSSQNKQREDSQGSRLSISD